MPPTSTITLPTLPDGWRYHVDLIGPDREQTILVAPAPKSPTGKVDGDHVVHVQQRDQKGRTLPESPSLRDALKTAAETARKFEALRVQRARADEAERAVLDSLGASTDPQPEPEPEPGPGAFGSATAGPMKA